MIRRLLELLDGRDRTLVESVVASLRAGHVPPTNPSYFGLFNQSPTEVTVVAEALVAAFNPQLAVRSHAPWPVDVEAELVRAFGERFGYREVEGSFVSGGAAANQTAVMAALVNAFPEFATRGARALDGDPVLYVSSEGHPTVTRAARVSGLGGDAVRVIPADASLRMKTSSLREAIARDRAAGARPFLIVATAGTTSAGTIDPLPELADVAERTGCWLHVDAAYGGFAALVPELSSLLEGIASADSITFDPHKSLSVPMCAALYLSRRVGVLEGAFRDRGGYMPRDASEDPYAHSLAWSRRFDGLKVHLAIESQGWDGIAASLRRRTALGDRLRDGLRAHGWTIVNDTKLPVVCFTDPRVRSLDLVARAVNTGGAWISVTKLSTGVRALRACITNHATTEEHVDALIASLDRARLAA